MKSNDSRCDTYYEVLQRASSFLEENNQSNFAAEWLLRERLGWSKTELVMHYHQTIAPEEKAQLEQDLSDFIQGIPMQYIIGHDWFYNRKFKVTPNTLIPRPETEEWLDRVIKWVPTDQPLKILDIGTGSGVLAITMQLERPAAKVIATDISEKALAVAVENGKQLEAPVIFKHGNLFEPVKGQKFDIILCNPPYISQAEIPLMDQSVLNHEPAEALFADNEGLAIYEAIAESILDYLNPHGMAFFEIGFAQGAAVSNLFQAIIPHAKIEVWQDMSQLDRVVAIYL